jgi:hypothetical protein
MSPNCVDVGVDGDLAIYDAQHGSRRVFKVDRVFDQHMTQQLVYEDTQPLIRSVLDGELVVGSRRRQLAGHRRALVSRTCSPLIAFVALR